MVRRVRATEPGPTWSEGLTIAHTLERDRLMARVLQLRGTLAAVQRRRSRSGGRGGFPTTPPAPASQLEQLEDELLCDLSAAETALERYWLREAAVKAQDAARRSPRGS